MMRLTGVPGVRRTGTAVAALLWAGVGPAGAQVGDTAAAEAIRPGVLFDSDAPLHLRIAGDLKTLIDDRDSLTSSEHPFTLTYRDGEGAPVTLEVEIRTRGHWRRQARHCDFPPLRLDLPRRRLDGTIFVDQDKLKLVTPCRARQRAFEEYVLREYAVYPVYNLLTPLSLRARLATTTYVDTRGRMDSLTVATFLIEDAARMAVRNGGRLLDVKGARFGDVDSLQLGLVGVFLYMIGGTDWSLSGLHNMELILDQQRGTFVPVTYDFDFTGIVNAPYARPDPRLQLRSVRERRYRGACLSEEHWGAVLDRFRAHKAAIYAIYETLAGLSSGYVRDTHRYLDEFYRVIDDPGRRSSELVRRCSPEERV
jgi:hypothetical protein